MADWGAAETPTNNTICGGKQAVLQSLGQQLEDVVFLFHVKLAGRWAIAFGCAEARKEDDDGELIIPKIAWIQFDGKRFGAEFTIAFSFPCTKCVERYNVHETWSARRDSLEAISTRNHVMRLHYWMGTCMRSTLIGFLLASTSHM